MAEVDYPLRLKQTLAALQKMRAKVDSLQQARTEPIAVIGMACRFPGGVTSPASYWELLRNGVDAIRDIPADRWDIEQYYDPDPDAPGKMYIRQGGFIENVDQFDPQFFGISPREAIRLDPQQRLFLEVAWEALEHAGLAPAVMKGSQTGVFVGVTGMDYMQLQFQRTPLPEIDAYFTTGNILNAVAGRVAYTLGFHGPTLAIDTACSSSLTAVHIACQNLRAGETNMAIAGGVNLVLLPEALVSFCRWGMLAPDARCKTFDDRADGFIRGEGCGAVILKRLSDALAEGDNIMALILGSAANQDGPSSGFSVPNGLAQQAVIRQALTNAGVEPLAVDYVEAHGTGTSLGDPIEVEALGSALCQERPADQPLTIGSVKTNIGHTEAASGIAGLMKVVLALQHQEIPPHLHLQERSHRIDWEQWPIEIATERKAWPRSARPRIAGVSGFGFSGNNVHIVLGEAPERPRGAPTLERPYHLLTLSAKSEDALQALARDYVGFLSAQPEISLADLCFTANSGRSHFSYRLALTAESSSEIRDKLAAFAGAQPLSDASVKGLVYGAAQNHQPHKVVFLFSGQGAQSVGMGRELYTHSPTFRQVMDECDALLRPHLPHSLLAVLYGDDPAITALLDETAYTQPALFAVEYALATLWQSWGIRPAAVMGHSVGEYVAACVAGVMSLGDGLRLIAQRGRLMQSLPKNGAMVAVFAPAHVVTDAIGPLADQVSIAAYNAPSSIVISGSKESVETVVERLKKQKIKTHELAVSHAFHSPLMEPILDEFTAVVKQATFATPQLRFISNLTGQAASSELTTPEYWVRHLRQPVRFAQGMTSLLEGQYDCFVEIGPKPVLLGLARQSLQEDLGVWLPSLRLEKPEFEQMLHSLGELYVRGLPVDWPQVDGPYAQGKLRLPTYPFQRQRYWLESTQPRPIHRTFSRVEGLEHPLLGSRLQTAGTETIFENQVAMDSPAFLGDHRIFGNVVVPATAYLEMALAGARLTLGMDCIQLADVAVHQALIVAGESRPTIQLIVAPESDGITPFRILSLAENAQDSGAKWRLHASGKFSRGQTSVEVSTPLEAIQQRCSVELLGGLDYEQLRLQGIEFGPTFRGVERLWKNAQSTEMLGQVRLPEAAAASGGYHLHPALLDACLQTATVLKPVSTPDASSVVYLPLTLEHLHFYRQPSTQLWCHARLQSARSVEGERLVADFRLFDARGEVVADLVGLHFKRADAETLRRSVQKSIHANVDEWFHEIVWRPKALAAPEVKPPATSGCWLIFRDGKGVGAALVQRLAELGEANIQLLPGSHYAAIDPAAGIWQLNPAEPSHYDRLLAEPLLANGPALRGIVHLWSLDTPPSETLDARQILTWQALNCGSVLNLVQALSRLDQASGCKVCLVTAGVQPVPEAMAVAQGCEVAQAPLWGLGQTVALEYPQMTCLRVDLDPSAVLSAATDAVQPLLAEIWSTDGEDQVALRGQGRYVARLVRQSSPAPEPQTVLDEQPVRLDITERGVLDNLILLPSARRQPEAGEVEIRVRATGLNFRDVLKALGMYPGDTGPLGDECAGEVVAVGPGVERFQVGDKVFGIIPGAFATYVCARVEFITHMPESLDFEEAATIPIVFLTAHYALNHLAQMQPGESVLIHAAAGGVGMAAVQLAQRVGAVIFATAGSPDKRAYLHSLGVAHVLDSRSLAFA
ncbi:MAG: acyltransferase domain-containing protein, partial [Caldilineaceae bacterium]|nr:acyltransferase domain-containing protein [Caldilineaceae bacterium]